MSERDSICAHEEKPVPVLGRFKLRKPLLTGEKHARLTVLGYAGKIGKRQEAAWLCECECGVRVVVRGTHLRNGHSKSCGCLKIEIAISSNTTHGLTRSPEYGIWLAVIDRCENPSNQSFNSYGGRGVTICREWRESFLAFREFVGAKPFPRATLDRIDTNGDYEPGNVRWATSKTQNRNRTNNRLLTCDGVTQCVSAWAESTGIKSQTITKRLKLGWSERRAVTDKVKPYRTWRETCQSPRPILGLGLPAPATLTPGE